jgi:glycosyltransferase involved in cell wall biosynthesis
MNESLRLLSVSIEEVTPGTAAGTHVRELAAALARQGAMVEVVAPPTDGPPPRSVLSRLVRIARTLMQAASRLPQQEVLYLRAHPLLWPLARLARLRSIPVVQEVNGREADIFLTHPWARPMARMLIAMQRAQYRDASAIAAVTEGLAAWVRGLPGVNGRVGRVANGVNTGVFAPGAPRAKELPEAPYAVFFGGFHRWHGIGTILDAVRDPAWPAPVRMVFVGEGPEAPLVDAAAAEPQLAGRVVRFGRLDQPSLASIVSNSVGSLVIIENSGGKAETGLAPLKLFESLACGVPVVVSDQPSMADFVRNARCGLVVPERDPAALASAMADLAADHERAAAMGKRGREEAVARHSWDVKAAELLAFLAPLLPARRGVGLRPV